MVREDVRCDVCTGLLLWTDDDIGYKCITCARTPLITRQVSPELEVLLDWKIGLRPL